MSGSTSTMLTTVGTSMISAVLSPIVANAYSISRDQYGVYRHINKEILNLKLTLDEVNKILEEAEERQIDNHNVRELLRNMVDISYEARDVLDDFITSAAVNANRRSTPVTFDCLPPPFAFLLPILSCLGFYWSSGVQVVIPLAQRGIIAYHIKSIRDRLDDIMKTNDILEIKKYVDQKKDKVNVHGGSENVSNRQRPEKGPFQDKQRNAFVGRDAVKEDIMQIILNDTANHVAIIPILGMGGIGKTTLAQSIFNDPRVTEGATYPSKNRVWHCVGEKKLNAKEIITSFVDGLNPTSSLEVIQNRLVEKFKGDRFLIVLDDVWDVDRNDWKLLFEPLTNVGKGGVVILTTRIRKVVDATNAQIQDCLQPLSDEECWSIFESHAFADGNSNSRQDLVFIGKQIVGKLRGLPLAAEMVGCSLKNEPDVETWRSFLETKEWMLKKGNDDIMPALKWSYNRLPPHLKQCFTYCSLFPKDHKFDEKILIKIWMAHDIVPNVGRGVESRRLPEDVGAQYFKELVNASFFQCISGDYVMHDMIHDLALLVSNEDFVTLSREQSLPTQMDSVRHVSINHDDDYAKNLRLCKSKRILSMYTDVNKRSGAGSKVLSNDILFDVLKQWKSIRVLVLVDYGITEIPDCINELKHLRYLDVSYTRVRSLPDSLFELYNLQTLVVPYGVDLPKKVVNLKNLRHLRGASSTSCKVIAQLTSLQETSGVRVCEGDCISELRHLRGLRGKLEIYGLENVTSSEDAAQAKMQDKLFIDDLFLQFSRISYEEEHSFSSEECGISRDVLKALNCPPNLKSLWIRDYHGDQFPSWLTNAANSMRFLSFLDIYNCKVVELLQLDAFVSLKKLHVDYCSNLQRIILAKEVAATIDDLSIQYCPELSEMEIESLPSLWELYIYGCRKLISFPPCLVKIKRVTVKHAELSSLTFTSEGIKSLTYLRVYNCPMLKQFSIVEEGSSSSSESSSITAVLSLPDDGYVDSRTHKFEEDAEGRLVLNRR